MIYFPVIGLALGLFLALINYLLAPYLAPEILSMLLITALVVLTGGNHLIALKNSFSAGAVKTSAQKNDHGETLGFIAIVLVLLFKAAAVDSMDEKLSFSLLLTPVLARWGVLIFVYGYQDRCDEILRPSAEQVKFWHLMLTTLGTLALGFYGLGKRWILDRSRAFDFCFVGEKSAVSSPCQSDLPRSRRHDRTRRNAQPHPVRLAVNNAESFRRNGNF